jgi:hypothetical protein
MESSYQPDMRQKSPGLGSPFSSKFWTTYSCSFCVLVWLLDSSVENHPRSEGDIPEHVRTGRGRVKMLVWAEEEPLACL